MAVRVRSDTGEATPEKRYGVTNWSDYEPALANRGNRTIWFDHVSVKYNWTVAVPVGRRKPGLYSETAIQTCLMIKALFQLPYRATEGLMELLMRLCQRDLPVPDHTHMSRPAGAISVTVPHRPCNGPTHVDSTRLKAGGGGVVR
jgi:hypothetical protein